MLDRVARTYDSECGDHDLADAYDGTDHSDETNFVSIILYNVMHCFLIICSSVEKTSAYSLSQYFLYLPYGMQWRGCIVWRLLHLSKTV